MAKKPLMEPKAPLGPQYDFFDLLQGYVRRYGNKSLAEIVDEGKIYCTRQALHRALVGPNLPSTKLVREIARAVNCNEQEELAVLAAYAAACNDQVEQARRNPPKSATEVAATISPSHRDKQSSASTSFADQLRVLYEKAGRPTLAEVSRAASNENLHLSRSTLSDWLNGRSLPRDGSAVHFVIRFLADRAVTQGDDPPSHEMVWHLWIREAEMRGPAGHT